MAKQIQKIAVLGAGVMGAQIAGHLAGCGFDVLLLDILPMDDPKAGESKDLPAWRNRLAITACERLTKMRPPALYTTACLKRIRPGNIEDHLAEAGTLDWIIEVVPEQLKIKHELYEKIEAVKGEETIISSNTSGISLELLIKGRSEGFCRSFVITHFFNPVRYMKLVELVSGPKTDPVVTEAVKGVLEKGLGKGVVVAKDTPGFIANRIGLFAVMKAIRKTIDNKWPIDLVDKAMGPIAAFARSGIFRTADLVGLDTLLHVAKNTYELCPNDPFRDALLPPPEMEKLVQGGHLGTKSGSGFYKKEGSAISVYDFAESGYREKAKYKFDSIKKARKIEDPGERLKTFVDSDDEASHIARELLSDLLCYVNSVAKEIADSPQEIDCAMRWGYNWELGPFEMWHAVGADFIDAKPVFGIDEDVRKKTFLSGTKESRGVVEKNGSASLIDIGEEIICCEFHAKMNAIDPDIIAMMNRGIDLLDEDKYRGLLVANDAADFSVGANLFMIAMAIGGKSWDQIEDLVRAFQAVGMRMRYSKRPVVAAPTGRTLGGGCEVSMAAGNVVLAAETYMGLVELGVGLIPAGGGCKNFLLEMDQRAKEAFNGKNEIWYASADGGPFPKVAKAFETIAMARIAVSGPDAIQIGYLPKTTEVVLNRDHLMMQAKKYLLSIANDYEPPAERTLTLPGKGGMMAMVGRAKDLKLQGVISDYDVVLASQLAHVLSGGNIATLHNVTEQDILDLECEAFLKLCGMEKTVARIQHMLTTGKPLRN